MNYTKESRALDRLGDTTLDTRFLADINITDAGREVECRGCGKRIPKGVLHIKKTYITNGRYIANSRYCTTCINKFSKSGIKFLQSLILKTKQYGKSREYREKMFIAYMSRGK